MTASSRHQLSFSKLADWRGSVTRFSLRQPPAESPQSHQRLTCSLRGQLTLLAVVEEDAAARCARYSLPNDCICRVQADVQYSVVSCHESSSNLLSMEPQGLIQITSSDCNPPWVDRSTKEERIHKHSSVAGDQWSRGG